MIDPMSEICTDNTEKSKLPPEHATDKNEVLGGCNYERQKLSTQIETGLLISQRVQELAGTQRALTPEQLKKVCQHRTLSKKCKSEDWSCAF